MTFKAAVDDISPVDFETNFARQVEESSLGKRAYLTASVKVRLHQRSFREKVLTAYRSQCAFCRLRHRELLDAAHIIPDNLPESQPTVNNGLSLCKLHHAAYDSFLISISPEFIIKVRDDVLEEEDGPVLQHGLKGLHENKIVLPSSKTQWPSQDALSWRYDKFINSR